MACSQKWNEWLTDYCVPGNAVPTVKITLGTPFPGVPDGNDPWYWVQFFGHVTRMDSWICHLTSLEHSRCQSEGWHVKHTLLLDPFIKFYCHITLDWRTPPIQSSQTSSSYLAMHPGCRSPASQLWPQLSMEIHSGSRTLEAPRRNCYAPARCMRVMITMMKVFWRSYSLWVNVAVLSIISGTAMFFARATKKEKTSMVYVMWANSTYVMIRMIMLCVNARPIGRW